MSALPPSDAVKFGKIIGLLASDQDGERAAAALKATEFLRARQLGWPAVAEALVAVPAIRPEPPRVAAPPRHQVDARECLASPVAWKPHELDFLRQMAAQRSRPSERQRDWIDGLFDRVARQRRETANVEW